MSKAMANTSHCTCSERKSIANSPVNGEALSRLGNDSHGVAGKRGESKHRLVSCFSVSRCIFGSAALRLAKEGRGRPRCSPTNWSCSTGVCHGRAPSQLKIISHEICGIAD